MNTVHFDYINPHSTIPVPSGHFPSHLPPELMSFLKKPTKFIYCFIHVHGYGVIQQSMSKLLWATPLKKNDFSFSDDYQFPVFPQIGVMAFIPMPHSPVRLTGLIL